MEQVSWLPPSCIVFQYSPISMRTTLITLIMTINHINMRGRLFALRNELIILSSVYFPAYWEESFYVWHLKRSRTRIEQH
jgi:hypothetical protein